MIKKLLAIALCNLLFTACKQSETKPTTKTSKATSTIKYAKGFDILTIDNEKQLVIKKVFQNSSKQFVFTLANKTDIRNNSIKTPVESIVVTSTTHIPMLELLECEEKLVGFPNTKYISSKKTRSNIDTGKVIELGSEQDMNTEKLLEINPELVVGFSLHPNNKLYKNIQKAGIPVIFNGDWLEETPLGRAEWIKFFGVLLHKEKEADSIFKNIEAEYLKAKRLALQNKKQPKVLSGAMFKDIWNVPAGESFIATYFKDANLNYIWKDTQGTGSLPLSFESVFDKAQDATYWFNCGLFETKTQMQNANKHYASFSAFKNNKLFTIANTKGKTGGLIYYEKSPIRPDLVLKDLIKITQPNALPNYDLTFFKQL